MAMDQVHDLQQVYRKILHSMSHPGTISNLEPFAEKVDYDLPCYEATFLSAMTLLDAEVTFAIISENSQQLSTKLTAYTLAKSAPIHEADYIIVLQDALQQDIVEALQQCKIGNLIDPQFSSTWFLESSGIVNQAELLLTGPGIKDETELQIGLTKELWTTRNKRVKEYPLGIDLICLDNEANLVCVPRTTKIEILEVV
ncbi:MULTISPECIES: phosphonate C-P lyase system protein PhnH [Virgibacillus]|uniref:Alpha-D-ribose 1-methylphosphonate 5-triphosphate synthase subunit PhnH n=2 Tax=Virgibacillus TaxID=84406 RepID=A0A024Q807_9BACI|nr:MULTISPECIES: phosphonate C-P lyase system protein PhnH [Virgibacillus]EQB38444.1 hypothetical protein M948_07630 [Virgibacillus sp. CM-4]MYL41150.1 phosphonate C-P lyase system protein PhnH [Virgibacillus massiliensis]GGJ54656.1 phosphonate C-P lyase system protein PhnH [Virgibacillus kapii]CDQ38046.1 Alpha-D-ribose 1-methylphosphonate 5-triphosphate synthase subunit PhnH [Virgibacillus massiliensis]